MNNTLEQLERLGKLKNEGIITEEEFNTQKAALLSDKTASAPGTSVPEESAASGVDLTSPMEKSLGVIKKAAIVAFFIGLLPIPFADAPLIIITQVVMLKKVCDFYDRPMGMSLGFVFLSALCGPIIFSLFKFVPGLGSLVGACVAASTTWLVGRSTLNVLKQDIEFNFKNLKDGLFGIFKS